MKKSTITSMILLISVLTVSGCFTDKQEAQEEISTLMPEYNGPLVHTDSINQLIDAQLSCGPRNPGSKGHKQCMNYLVSYVKRYADTVFLQTFSSTVYGKTYDMANIIASFQPEKQERVLLCAHWDTRPFADEDILENKRTNPILGANDGASGVAILMEIARILSQYKPDIGIDIVLFDGEDLGLSGDLDGFFQGSRYMARNYPLQKPKYGILLDLVGDKQAEFRYEPLSKQVHPLLVEEIWNIAKRRQSSYFFHEMGNSVSDDHVMLNQAGIKTIDIIDVNLVGNTDPNPRRQYWHTTQDIKDQLSVQTMSELGNILLEFLFTKAQSVY